MKVEYKVRRISRFIVTRYHEEVGPPHLAGSQTKGEYENPEVAYEVAYALCKAEHDAAETGDPNFQYPEPLRMHTSDCALHNAPAYEPGCSCYD
jgi:hypothetical protein